MKKIFTCKACGLKYENKKLSKACNDFCIKYNACNIDIIKHAMKD